MNLTSPARAARRVVDPLKDYLHAEAAGGLALLAALMVALGWANSPLAGSYEALWSRELTIGVGGLAITEDLRHWVNDGLMTLFFFVVGLEIKRELVTGELRRPRLAAAPALAAVGGLLVPAAIFLMLNAGGEGARGWGIPVATDTAFALGILALLGSRVPASAKLFLLTMAIIDDVLAISTVAVFYSTGVSLGWLAVAAGGLVGVVVLRRSGVAAIAAYLPIGLLVWLATLESGVHATIAGVALGLATPARPVGGRPVLEELSHRLHPVSGYLVVPLFALANGGLPLGRDTLAAAAASPVAWGIVLGLVVGKLVGISVASLAAVRLGVGALPEGLAARHVLGLAALGGIGFTVSLFITELAYSTRELTDLAKAGILAGSLLSGLLGTLLLLSARHPDQDRRTPSKTGRGAISGRPESLPITGKHVPSESAGNAPGRGQQRTGSLRTVSRAANASPVGRAPAPAARSPPRRMIATISATAGRRLAVIISTPSPAAGRHAQTQRSSSAAERGGHHATRPDAGTARRRWRPGDPDPRGPATAGRAS